MSRVSVTLTAGLCVMLAGAEGCMSQASADAAETAVTAARAARLDTAIADTTGGSDEPIARWMLPGALREISGITLVGKDRLLAHGDERGVIWEIDYRRGALLKRFSVGTPTLSTDFEGITNANGQIFLLASSGKLYEFREGNANEHVDYKVHDTKLGKECEFEGVAFDSASNSLLLACKRILQKSLGDGLLIYRWKLDGTGDDRLTSVAVPFAAAVADNGWKELRPSDIAVDPATGNYVIIASQQKGLIVITPAGQVVRSESLPKGHTQPEGVAITADHILILSDEAVTHSANITLYRWR